jgi:hypothetical protein
MFERVKSLMLAEFVPGNDPGLCVAANVPPTVVAFGRRAQSTLVDQNEAWQLATHSGRASPVEGW